MSRMTILEDALHMLNLHGEVELKGTWVKLAGERCTVYVAEVADGSFLTWCDAPGERTVQAFPDPIAAIRAGLHRGRQLP